MIKTLERKIIFPGSSYKITIDDFDWAKKSDITYLITNSLQRIAFIYGSSLDDSEFEGKIHLIFCYGNAGSLKDSKFELDFFRYMGFNTWIPDYIGYGLSTGIASERGCIETISTLFDYLIDEKKIDPQKIIVAGHSLGAAVSLHLASSKQIGGVFLFSPFTSIIEMAKNITIFSWMPIQYLIETRFDNLGRITNIYCPILIVHGTEDEVIPYSMGVSLFQASNSKEKFFVSIEGANHNNIFSFGSPLMISEISRMGRIILNNNR